MSGKTLSYFLLMFLSTALIATAFVLVLTHNKGACTYTLNGADEKDCTGSFDFLCAGPALVVDVVLPKSIFETHKICPWREPTSILMYVSFGFSMLFVLTLGLNMWTRSLSLIKIEFIFGVFALGCLIAALILMIFDMVDGNDKKTDFYRAYTSVQMSQTVFRVNAAMVALGILCIGLLMIVTFTRYRMSAKEIVSEQEVPFHQMTA